MANYDDLTHILFAALEQAEHGKGKERHAGDRDFVDQPIMTIGRRYGIGFNLGQAEKKMQEADGMLKRGEPAAFERELLGAVVYLASAVMLVRERQSKGVGNDIRGSEADVPGV